MMKHIPSGHSLNTNLSSSGGAFLFFQLVSFLVSPLDKHKKDSALKIMKPYAPS